MKKIYKNTGILFFAQVVSYLIPILEIPILAKSLGAVQFGTVVLIQASASLLSMVVEYGFSLSASRQVAVSINDKKNIRDIYGGVTSAKLILTCIISFTILLLFVFFDIDIDYFHLIWGGIYFLAFSFSSFWLFQGLEKIARVVIMEVVLRFVGLLFLFLLINTPADTEKALMIMSLFALLNTALCFGMAIKLVGLFSLDFNRGFLYVKDGFHGFIYKSSNNIMLSAGPALVGFLCGQASLAKFVPADKIIKASTGLIGPVLIGIYPALSRRLMLSKEINLRASWVIVCLLFFMGVVGATVIYYLGDFLIVNLLGSEYLEAVSVLRVFVLIVPFRIMNQAIGLTIFMPLAKDKILSFLLIFFSLLALVISAVLSIWFGLVGVISGFVLSEILFSMMLILLALRIR